MGKRFLWELYIERLKSRIDIKEFNRNEKKSNDKTEIKIFIKDFGTVRTSYNYSEDPYTRVLSSSIKK